MLIRYIKYAPDVTLVPNNHVLASVLQCGLLGFGVEHREAGKTLLVFFDEFLNSGT